MRNFIHNVTLVWQMQSFWHLTWNNKLGGQDPASIQFQFLLADFVVSLSLFLSFSLCTDTLIQKINTKKSRKKKIMFFARRLATFEGNHKNSSYLFTMDMINFFFCCAFSWLLTRNMQYYANICDWNASNSASCVLNVRKTIDDSGNKDT